MMKAATMTVSSMAWFPRNEKPSRGRIPMTTGMSAQWMAQNKDADMPSLSSLFAHFGDCSTLMYDSIPRYFAN